MGSRAHQAFMHAKAPKQNALAESPIAGTDFSLYATIHRIWRVNHRGGSRAKVYPRLWTASVAATWVSMEWDLRAPEESGS
jgi:hypothetical protein